ncbi:hypothetical protein BJX64DRAFT_271564 [Aspergillus heterothallicus]
MKRELCGWHCRRTLECGRRWRWHLMVASIDVGVGVGVCSASHFRFIAMRRSHDSTEDEPKSSFRANKNMRSNAQHQQTSLSIRFVRIRQH